MTFQMDNEGLTERDRKGLRAAIKIMEKWGLDHESQAQLLDVDDEQLNTPASVERLNDQQLTKISYLLNIHASLRDLFQNPENQYGYMRSVNHNPPFNGQSPLDFIRSSEPPALKEVFDHLELVKYGQ